MPLLNNRLKAERGIYPAGEKAGYQWDPNADRGSKGLIPFEPHFSLLKRAFHLIVSGTEIPAEVLRKLNDDWGYRTRKRKHQGGKPMTVSQFYAILSDPFYYGEFEFPENSGNWYCQDPISLDT